MKIAIIGSGISGLTAAYLLHKDHDVRVFESADRIGGHTATKSVQDGKNQLNVDTGFIVFNDRTYPNFIRLMNQLGVESQPTRMSFSVRHLISGLEYSGSNLDSLFCQRRNIFRPSFIKMVFDILRFNKTSIAELDLDQIPADLPLGKYLSKKGYGKELRDLYLIPMGSAIWSQSEQEMLHMPALFFIRFFKNHGLLSIKNRPQWRTIIGGSKCYLEPLTQGFSDKIIVNCQIEQVVRDASAVTIQFKDRLDSQEQIQQETFDQVIFACHSNQALRLLKDPTETEAEILGAIPYQSNDVVLHTDQTLLPKNKKAWSAWNYQISDQHDHLPILSYNMNMLQKLNSNKTFVVTLNATDKIDPDKILGRYTYAHPQFNEQSVLAQNRWKEINGPNRTWFCGAYWANGFHEDGCASGIRVAKGLGASWS